MGESLAEIKQKLEQVPLEKIETILKLYGDDNRIGVQKLLIKYKKKLEGLEAERKRMKQMFFYEEKYSRESQRPILICGIDEAGRGSLAGPVTAGAVILDPSREILYLNDSKKLTEAMRERLYDEIMDKALSVAVGSADWNCIDEINILQATYKAMRQATGKLAVKPDLFLNDHVVIPGISQRQIGIDHGDALSASIAAASIVAKVTRDRQMKEYDKQYPGYGFAKHKGYGTKEHIEALKKLGASPIHRQSFIQSYVNGVG